MDQPTTCPKCHNLVIPGSNFCSTCGLPLIPVGPITISIGRQVYIYAVSILLPPLGLIWTFKYLSSDSPQARKVAIIATVLTAISLVVTIWWAVSWYSNLQSQISSYSSLGL